jgi:amino acid transporter
MSADSDPATGADSLVDRAPTALPSVTARVLGFLAIIVSGAVGAFIGYGFTDLQNHSSSTTANAVGALIGGLIGAGGVAVVVVLALRAMGEWQSVQRRPTGPDRPATPPTQRPRVR